MLNGPFACCSQDALFKDFRIESNFNNQINLEIASDSLLKALRSAQNAVDVTMRLAKRNKDPLLSFMIVNAVGVLASHEEKFTSVAQRCSCSSLDLTSDFRPFPLKSRSGARLEIVQDVLIKVLKPAEIERIKEPLCPEPDVSSTVSRRYSHLKLASPHLSEADILNIRRSNHLAHPILLYLVRCTSSYRHYKPYER